MDAFSSVYDTYRDAMLAEFRKRGGKLLIFHGTADPIFSALESIDYYRRLTRNSGGPESTGRWARLFLVPGMNHCAGGPATDSFDGLAAIVDWVEKGATPVRIEASARPGAPYSRDGRVRSVRIPPMRGTSVREVWQTARISFAPQERTDGDDDATGSFRFAALPPRRQEDLVGRVESSRA
jgi:hypothetical protein